VSTRATERGVANDGLVRHAERLVSGPVSRADLALAFDESSAASAEVLVEGEQFYPPMLEDILRASSSVHINQFGFKPGIVGESFADALVAKAAEGVAVRLVVDNQGSDPEGGSHELYARLRSAGIEICVVRATKARVADGPLGGGGATRWNLSTLGHVDHRKVIVVDGRIGWIGGAGIEDHFNDGRFHDLFVRMEGPVSPSSSSSFSRASAGSAGRSPPTRSGRSSRRSSPAGSPPRSCTTRPAATGRSATRSAASSTRQPRRSTSSIPTSPTGA
jgi:cardiolipin synthase